MKILYWLKNFFSIDKIVRIFSLFFIMVAVLIFFAFSLRSLAYPYILDYGEGHTLNYSVLLREYGNYFIDINSYPYIHAAYPPVFPFLVFIIMKFFGASFFIGRIISFFSTIGTILILYKLFYFECREKINSFIVSSLFIAPYFVIQWAALARVDMLAIFFSIFGLYLYYVYGKKNSPLRFLSVIFFILAIFTKQNAIAAPLSIILEKIFKDKGEALRFSLLYAIPTLLLFVFFNYKTQGQFYLHLVPYLKSIVPVQFYLLPQHYQNFFRIFPFFLFLIITNLVLWRKYKLFLWYFFLNSIFFFTSANTGANVNHSMELYLSLLISAGFTFMYILQKIKDQGVYKILIYSFFIQILLLFPLNNLLDIIWFPLVPAGYGRRLAINYYLRQNGKGPILSEDFGHLVLSDIPAQYESYAMMMLAQNRKWNTSPLLQDCNEKKFKLVIAGWRILKIEGVEECLEKNYELVDVLKTLDDKEIEYQIYLPK